MVVACPISVQAKGEPAAMVPATIQPKSVPQGESSKLMAWSLAVPDWQDQIRTGKSLIPDLPLLDSQQCFATTGCTGARSKCGGRTNVGATSIKWRGICRGQIGRSVSGTAGRLSRICRCSTKWQRRAVDVFDRLRLPDVPGKPTLERSRSACGSTCLNDRCRSSDD